MCIRDRSRTVQTIQDLQPNATVVEDGLSGALRGEGPAAQKEREKALRPKAISLYRRIKIKGMEKYISQEYDKKRIR